MARSTLKVLIAGGGIAGLTLAYGLRRAGVECDAFERSERDSAPAGYRLTLDADRPLLAAIAAFEADMREATHPLMAIASDHDSFGGGGLRREEVQR